ncbi:MAG: hypothetical protein WKG00_15540 [Polyangiaceae bacterium]
MRRTTLSILVALAPIAFASSARADLRADAQRLTRAWTARGARVEPLPPLFLEGGRVRSLPLDPYARATPTHCTALVLLAERGAELTVYGVEALLEARRAGEEPARDRGDEPREDDGKVRSSAGALMMERCGAARAELTRLVVEMRASRGAVEGLLVRSNARIGSLDDILPERAGGPPPPRGDVGHPVEPDRWRRGWSAPVAAQLPTARAAAPRSRCAPAPAARVRSPCVSSTAATAWRSWPRCRARCRGESRTSTPRSARARPAACWRVIAPMPPTRAATSGGGAPRRSR